MSWLNLPLIQRVGRKVVISVVKALQNTIKWKRRGYFLYFSGYFTVEPLITHSSWHASRLARELIIPQKNSKLSPRAAREVTASTASRSGAHSKRNSLLNAGASDSAKAAAGEMRKMSNIPKLQAHTKRSSCRGVKVSAHNKELCESALTLLWLPCPAATATRSSPCGLLS